MMEPQNIEPTKSPNNNEKNPQYIKKYNFSPKINKNENQFSTPLKTMLLTLGIEYYYYYIHDQ